MSTEANAVLMIGLSVEELGLSVEDISNLPEWDDSQYLKDDIRLDVEWENSYTGPEDHDTYIGFNMSKDLKLCYADSYRFRFKELFGKEAKTLLFATIS
jgi:hypothetical protein